MSRTWNWCDTLAVVLLPLVVIASKASVLTTPFYWDEIGWSRYAHVLSQRPLWRFVALNHPLTFAGHPPGLFLPAAALFRIAGESSGVAHAMIMAYAAIGLVFTYLLASLWFGRTAGVTAAALLWLTPIYFAQSAMFLADLPVAAVGIATVYFAVRDARIGYLLCATYLVLIKETGNAIPLAIAAYAVSLHFRISRWEALRRAGFFAAPLIVSVAFHGFQWVMTGHIAWVYSNHAQLTDLSAGNFFFKLGLASQWLFLLERQWMVIALILLGLILRPAFRKRRELVLSALIVLFSGYSFVIVSFLPRYMMPVFPHLCIWAGGAIVALVEQTILRYVFVVLALAMKGSGIAGVDRADNDEWNMGYLRQVSAQRQICRFIERYPPEARVLCDWPMTALLTEPRLNYVSRPGKIVCVGDDPRCFPDISAVTPAGFDLLVSGPVDELPGVLRKYATDSRLPMIQRFGSDGVTAELFGK